MVIQPYHRRPRPTPQTYTLFEYNRIDLTEVALPPYPTPNPKGVLPNSRQGANRLFDGRAAAGVSANIGDPASVRIEPRENKDTAQFDKDKNLFLGFSDPEALLEFKDYRESEAPSVFLLTAKCLAAMAYADYFPDAPRAATLRSMVSEAILQASPGWCGTFGPGATGALSLKGYEGNYDFYQMFMLPLVYNFYDELRPEARERLITLLLARGRIQRPNEDDTFTSGGPPNDWSRAGHISPAGSEVDIPETENHVLLIATARYLTNQLLYQRDNNPWYDNRRNGSLGDLRPTCVNQLLSLLRNYLRDDFAEYNAKPYQEETRHALLNLCSYAYDTEVRLGARVVLDYISAHIAISSNDLRRMVPFRRRNDMENEHTKQIEHEPGFMDINLLQDSHGADLMAAHFALLTGNTRAYQRSDDEGDRPWNWAITPNFGQELTLEALSSYRLPPSVHDLFINDLHRRFFQRIHRHPLEEPGQQRNCENMEIYSGSPSYLVTAGGKPANHVIPGLLGFGVDDSNIGVAMPTSFMPTGFSAANFSSLQELAKSAGVYTRPISLKGVARVFGRSAPVSFTELSKGIVNTNNSSDLIQFLRFSDVFYDENETHLGGTENYGVAPDFACGFAYHLPTWTGVPKEKDGIFFVNRKSLRGELAGFFLAIIKQDEFVLLEAFDTWFHPEVSFERFQSNVKKENQNIQLSSGKETEYTTYFGNRIRFVIWRVGEQDSHDFGSKIINIEYGEGAHSDTLVEAGNYADQSQFLSGNILKSAGDAVVEVHNPLLGTKMTLDWSRSSPSLLVRTSEDGDVEQGGINAEGQIFEVWVDFNWNGPTDGDFYHPFSQLASAVAEVADGGVIKIAPGSTRVRGEVLGGKRMRVVAPLGGVTIGAH